MADGLADMTGAATADMPAALPAVQLSSQHDPCVDDAVFMGTRAPLSANMLQTGAKLLDITAATLIALTCLTASGLTLFGASIGEALPFFLVPFAAIFGARNANAYGFVFTRSLTGHLLRVANGTGLALLTLMLALWAIIGTQAMAAPMIAAQLTWVTLLALHIHYIAGIKMLTRANRLSERVVIVGATPNARALIARNNETRELNIVGVFDDRLARAPRDLSGVPLLGRIDELMRWDRLPEIDRIIVTVTPDAKARVRALIDRLRILPQQIVLLLDFGDFNPETESLAEIARSPAAYVSGHPKDARRALVKRLSDVVFASLMLIAFSPVLAISAMLIKLEGKGPVFFRQRRHGFNNEVIRVWKFRTLHPNKGAEDCMESQVTPNDPRVTTMGRILRKTSIDELPQLVNVLSGEMSIVGPRPHAVGMTTEETAIHEIVGDYAHRHRVKPGITGWAQVNNSRGPVHTKMEVRERVRLDMEYVNRASFWLDVQIMLMTAPCMLSDIKRDR